MTELDFNLVTSRFVRRFPYDVTLGGYGTFDFQILFNLHAQPPTALPFMGTRLDLKLAVTDLLNRQPILVYDYAPVGRAYLVALSGQF